MSELKYTKASNWNERSLEGNWGFSYKIDGVRALRGPNDTVVSRAGKPLYNITLPEGITDAEIYLGSWEASVSAVRTHNGTPVPLESVYSLSPLDDRLYIGEIENPEAHIIKRMMTIAVAAGYEGLILRGPKGQWLRVKPKNSYDVRVTGYQEGKGRNVGRCGALLTSMGKVGTGLTDDIREQWALRHAHGNCIGSLIEVESMGLTPQGKFRHPRYKGERWDKEESDEQTNG